MSNLMHLPASLAGYMNNIPVDVMRGLGVETVIVVDVEGKDDMGEWGKEDGPVCQGRALLCMIFGTRYQDKWSDGPNVGFYMQLRCECTI